MKMMMFMQKELDAKGEPSRIMDGYNGGYNSYVYCWGVVSSRWGVACRDLLGR
jgi:hypothetical protein